MTPDNGSFRFPALPVGIYALEAAKSGFAPAKIERVEVRVNEITTADLSLTIAQSAQTVTVESNVALTDTETAHLGGVIEETQVTTLPLNGRNFAQLALLNAGVSASGGGGGQQGGEGGSLRLFIERTALHLEQLHGRRHRQQQLRSGQRRAASLHRFDSGISGDDQQLLRRVRTQQRLQSSTW